MALELLERLDYPIRGLRPKPWEEFAKAGAPALDFVITVCDNAAGEVCPFFPGQPVSAHWGVPDPAAVGGSAAVRRLAFPETHRRLATRIGLFVNLPLASLDRLSLQRRLRQIGAEADIPRGRGS